MTAFVIVTPCLNARPWIDDTIASVVSQAGEVDIHHHVQDGGSRDGTVERLDRWARAFEAGTLPLACRSVRFSVSSGPDGGLYDAVARGFEEAGYGAGTMMSWINASDRLAPGALQTVADLRAAFPGVSWMAGRTARLNARGSVVRIEDPVAYPQRTLAAGLHDNRHLPVLQQEGCFWTGDLWRRAGGLDRSLRVAGDFDLWRRFAGHAPLAMVNAPLGFFRHHAGQKGGDWAAYVGEIDALLDGEAASLREATWRDYRTLTSPKDHGGLVRGGFSGPMLQFVEGEDVWMLLDRFPFFQR